jgi:hypothetical protein
MERLVAPDHGVPGAGCGVTGWLVAGAVLIGCSVAAIVAWGMLTAAAGREFERELGRGGVTGGDMITALRRDIYLRAGLSPMMAGPAPVRAPRTGRARPE